MSEIKSRPASKIIYSLLINALFLIIALLVFRPFFEEIDDTHIAMISEGAYGIREWHLIYPNVILGKLYVLLGTLFPLVRWHVIIQYIFVFLAYCALTYILCKHKNGYILSFAVILSTFYELYVSIQYTKTAAFVCTVGLLLAFRYVRNRKKIESIDSLVTKRYADESYRLLKIENILFIIGSFLFVFYGTLLRKESFFIACVPVVSFGFLELFRTRLIKKYLTVFIPMFVMVFAAILFDSFIYSNDSEWNGFMKYNEQRSQLTDYRHDILDYTRYSDKLKDLSVSENDAIIILTYQFGDDKVFSYDKFKEIRDSFPAKSFDLKLFKDFCGNVLDEMMRPNVIIYALILFGVILVVIIIVEGSKSDADYISESRMKRLTAVFIAILCACALFYFHYSGRWSHRLSASLIIPAIIVIIFMLDNDLIQNDNAFSRQNIHFAGNKKDISVTLLAVTIITTIGLNAFVCYKNETSYDLYKSDSQITGANEAITSIKLLNADERQKYLFVADTFTFQDVFKYDVFNASAVGELSDFVTCGSWFMNSPVTKSITGKFGYENPYEALLSGEENIVLLDDKCADNKLIYIREHYDSECDFEPADVIGGVKNYYVR